MYSEKFQHVKAYPCKLQIRLPNKREQKGLDPGYGQQNRFAREQYKIANPNTTLTCNKLFERLNNRCRKNICLSVIEI